MHFAYRHSSLDELVILDAEFQLEEDDPQQLTQRMQKLWIVRRASQPLSDRNAAYIFKDHGGQSASELIEDAGLKGTQIGKVEISDRDPNVFVTHQGATSGDVLRLIDLVKTQVSDRLSVDLEPAIEVW